jgi:hypothetical protein
MKAPNSYLTVNEDDEMYFMERFAMRSFSA